MSREQKEKKKPENNVFQPRGPGAERIAKPAKATAAWPTVRRLLAYLKNAWPVVLFASFANISVTVMTIYSMRLMGVAVDKYIATYDPSGLAKLCFILVALFALTSTLTYIELRIMATLAQKIAHRLRKDVYETILRLPLSYFDKHSSGDVMSRLTNDVDNVNTTLSESISALLEGVINIVGMLIAMYLLSPILTGWSILVLPLTFFSTRLVVHFSRRFFTRLQNDLGAMNGYVEEMISAQKMLLLYDQQNSTFRQFKKMNRTLTHSYQWAQTLSTLGPLMSFINNISYFIVTVAGAYYIVHGDRLTVGVLFSFLLYMRRFARPLNDIAALFNTIQSAIAGAERIFTVIDAEKENEENLSAYRFQGGHIRYEGVSFSYGDDLVLKNISFEVPAGGTVAIVGATGSGKTTLASLLNRFYDPTEGRILIDGQDTRTLTRRSLRKEIGLVFQDTFLFTESVRDNIRYGAPHATDAAVESAACDADAALFIAQLPNGYDTVLSDNGGNFSQGQRQLLAISRALLANTSILILDEATSSIDTRTERIVQKSLKRLTEGRTTFIIAHRLSTIRDADQILVLDRGEIIEQGTHKELLALGGTYAHMYTSQYASLSVSYQ